MLKVRPKDGSRSVSIDTPYLRLELVVTEYEGPLYDRDGSRVGEVTACLLRDPRKPPTADDIRLAEVKAAICEPCESFRGLVRESQGRPAYIVQCHRCTTCGGVRLLTGKCPAGHHDRVT
jgi:hypothetical protein